MTDTTAAHLALVQRWEDTFNNDLEAMVHEVYAPDAVLGGIVMGPDKLLRFEKRVMAAAPRRFMRVERSHVAGDVVTVYLSLARAGAVQAQATVVPYAGLEKALAASDTSK